MLPHIECKSVVNTVFQWDVLCNDLLYFWNHTLFLCFQFSVVFLTTSFQLFQPRSIWTAWLLVSVQSGSLCCWTWVCPQQIRTGAAPTTPLRFRFRCSLGWWCGRRGTEEKPQCGDCSRACRPQTPHHLSSNRCLCDITSCVFLDFILLLSCGKHDRHWRRRNRQSLRDFLYFVTGMYWNFIIHVIWLGKLWNWSCHTVFMPFNIKIFFLNYASEIYFVLPLKVSIFIPLNTFYTYFLECKLPCYFNITLW